MLFCSFTGDVVLEQLKAALNVTIKEKNKEIMWVKI
jgi:hypothetical protein